MLDYKKYKNACILCGECMITETKDGYVKYCTEYNNGRILLDPVIHCSHFYLSSKLAENMTKAEIKEIKNHFRLNVLKCA